MAKEVLTVFGRQIVYDGLKETREALQAWEHGTFQFSDNQLRMQPYRLEEPAPVVVYWDTAIGSLGLKAGADLPPDTFVGEYAGLRLTPSEVLATVPYTPRACYSFGLPMGGAVDASEVGNLTRLINHQCTEANCQHC